MLPLKVNDDLTIALLTDSDAAAFFNLIASNRDRLDPWMMWSARVQNIDDAHGLIERSRTRFEANNGFHAGMWYRGQLAGGFAIREIDRASNNAEIGYWLGREFVGKGLVMQAAIAVINELFQREKLHRIEIQATSDNQRSRAVAERLGFTLEGILRESEMIQGQYRDHAMYSLLDREWAASPFATAQH